MAEGLGGLSDFEVQILLMVKSSLDDLKKTKDGLKEMGNEGRKAGNSANQSFVGLNKSLRGLLAPLIAIRRSLMLMRMAFLLVFGGIIGSVVLAIKELEQLEKTSLKTGQSLRELSKSSYGVSFSRDDLESLRKLSGAIADSWQVIVGWTMKFGVAIQKFLPFAVQLQKALEMIGATNLRGKEQRQAIEQLIDQTDRLTMTESDYRRKQLRDTYNEHKRILRLETNNVGKEYEYRKSILDNWVTTQFDALEDAKWGFKSFYESISSMQKEFGSSTATLLGDTFIDVLDNKMKNAQQIFADYLLKMRNMLIHFAAEQATRKFFKFIEENILGTRKKDFDKIISEVTDVECPETNVYTKICNIYTDIVTKAEKASPDTVKAAIDTAALIGKTQDVARAIRVGGSVMVENFKQTHRLMFATTNFLGSTVVQSSNGIINAIRGVSSSQGKSGFNWGSIIGNVIGTIATGGNPIGGQIGGAVGGQVQSGVDSGWSSQTNYQTPTIEDWSKKGIEGKARGGIVGLNGEEIIRVGEVEPEAVIPLSKLNRRSQDSGNVVNYYIQAVDPQSFASLVMRNPEAIVAVTSESITKNKNLRKTIKEYGR